MMTYSKNVGRTPARCGRSVETHDHYITKRDAAAIAVAVRDKQEKKGIFRRWNKRKLTPEQKRRAAAALRAARKKSAS